LEITLKPVEDYREVEQVEKPHRPSAKGRRMGGEIVAILRALDQYDTPATPVEQYLDTRSGKYAVMLEAIVDAAASAGMWDLARATLVDLLRMTKVGKSKADVNIINKLRDEIPLKHLSDEELHGLVDKPAGD
jgi:hypothetical protein